MEKKAGVLQSARLIEELARYKFDPLIWNISFKLFSISLKILSIIILSDGWDVFFTKLNNFLIEPISFSSTSVAWNLIMILVSASLESKDGDEKNSSKY